MSAFCHDTSRDHGGGLGDEVTADQDGSPDRLCKMRSWTKEQSSCAFSSNAHLIEVTSHPRELAALHILLPVRKGSVSPVLNFHTFEGP